MKRSRRLEPVVKVAESKEQDAASALGNVQMALNLAEVRLDELKNYREEYIQRFHEKGAAGMAAVQMEDYRQFLHNLSQAILQQENIVSRAIEELEKQRQRWFVSRGETQMIENVVSRYKTDEQRALERQEQNEQDERAQHPRPSNP